MFFFFKHKTAYEGRISDWSSDVGSSDLLLGQGDMLYMAQGGRILRVHGPLVTDHEVEDVVAFLKKQGEPSYIEAITDDGESDFDGGGGFGGESSGRSEERRVGKECDSTCKSRW